MKARVDDLDRVSRLALDCGAFDYGTTRDTDIYFRAATGRLKLRVTEGKTGGTLIAYQRPDQAESRISDYLLVTIPDPHALRRALAMSLGEIVAVRKSRRLLVYGATRIHLDEVDSLGNFVELETVVSDQTWEDAEGEHRLLKKSLGLDQAQIVSVSYSDLLIEQND